MKRISNRLCIDRTGASAIVVVNLFVVMMVFAFMAINLSNLQRHFTASQISSDLAARWGVDMLSRTDDIDLVEEEVRELARRNWTVSNNLPEDWLENNRQNVEIDIDFGTARVNSGGVSFDQGQLPYNSLRVVSRSNVGVQGFMPLAAGDFSVNRAATAIALERDICLVIDRSGSMNFDLDTGNWMYDTSWHDYNELSKSSYYGYRDISYQWWYYRAHPTRSRWSTMVPALYSLAAELDTTKQNEKFSIVSYSSNHGIYFYDFDLNTKYYSGSKSAVEIAPTFDYESAVSSLENTYKYDKLIAGGTDISAGIDEAVTVLTGSTARPNAYKTMIVMTDGQYNYGRPPWEAAADAADEGIEVYTVTFSSQANQTNMIQTAEDGNGLHFHAPDGDALESVFREIANIPPAAYIE